MKSRYRHVTREQLEALAHVIRKIDEVWALSRSRPASSGSVLFEVLWLTRWVMWRRLLGRIGTLLPVHASTYSRILWTLSRADQFLARGEPVERDSLCDDLRAVRDRLWQPLMAR